MSAHDIVLIVHLLLFCYWLGGDIGVFYSSGMVIDPKLSNSARMTAAKIMINLDLVPRICMSLMLTVGGILVHYEGWEHPLWQWIGIILLGPFWLTMVLLIHFREGTDFAKNLTRIDFWFRWIIIVSVVASSTVQFMTGGYDESPWIGYKLYLFAGLVFCGLVIRMNLGPFVQGVHRLALGNIDDEANIAMAASLNRVRPFVILIWIGLVIEAGLGVVEPGGVEAATAMTALP